MLGRRRNVDNCFLALGLLPGASLNDCKSSYRSMIKTWHPDRFAENAPHRLNAEQISRELNLAFDTIREYYAAQSAKKPLRVVRIRKKRRKQSRKTKIAKAVKETVEKVKTGSSSLASCTAFVVRNDFSEILRKKAA